MNIGLYFGSFNPIHNGHISIAQELLKKRELNEIWMVLSPQSPVKKSTLNKEIRLSLMEIGLRGLKNITISKVEFNMPLPNYTSNTLNKILKDYPNENFKIIMGHDNYENISSWKDYQFILDNFEIIVYPREKDHITNEFPEVFDVSSTQIRDNIKNNKSIKDLVPVGVEKEILEKKYFTK